MADRADPLTSEVITDLLVGQILADRYHLESRIGAGPLGTVFLGRDLKSGGAVAVKVLASRLAVVDEAADLFLAEARSASTLSDPGLVRVLDQGRSGGQVYVVSEFVPGRNLRSLVTERGRLTPHEALSYLRSILAALSAAHLAGLAHRGVKPENVLLAADGSVRLTDLGLARAERPDSLARVGTAAYLAPEQLTEGRADARSDVYSCGILLYELLTGRQPYDDHSQVRVAYRHVNEDVPRPSEIALAVPERLDTLVLTATAREPMARFVDAARMLAAVVEVGATLPVRAEPPAAIPPVLSYADLGGAGAAVPLLEGMAQGPAGPGLPGDQAYGGLFTDGTPSPYGENGMSPYDQAGRPYGDDLLSFNEGPGPVNGPGAGPLGDGPPPGGWQPYGGTGPDGPSVPGVGGPRPTQTLETQPGEFGGRHRAELPGVSWARLGVERAKERPLVAGGILVGAFVLVGALLLAVSGGGGGDTHKVAVAPSGGTSAAPTLSASPAGFTIPYMRGMPLAQAREQFSQAGVTIETTTEASNGVARGRVLRTDPADGTTVVPGRDTVTIYVSTGDPTPTPQPSSSASGQPTQAQPGFVQVPRVIGMPFGQAAATLRAAGLQPRIQTRGHGRHGDQGNGVVTAQFPVGATVPRGTTVIIFG